MPSFKQSNKSLDELPERLHKFAELLAEGELTKADCMRSAGFADSTARHPNYIGPTRERSKYPALWDYYTKLRNHRIRLFDVNAETIRDELRLIAFSKLTDFIQIPTRKDHERQKLFDAHIRRSMGYRDEEDDALFAKNDALRKELSESKAEKLQRFAPGASVKLRCLEDIPPEYLPALAALEETRDGIKIKLHNKLDALDKLARICRLYEDPSQGDKPTTIENLNLIVRGSKSDLLDKINDI